ncbi:hypothetical protein DNL40_15325 [Xylanimonas oleitrophica]|uniref:Uncharacterized protein n=1 Tax=Xylanimonas oleitrophica TaxID=2607479 RepID=A0A2W5WKQ9_9MICO|nr:hypothetical protein [Xylanimonas oleitrophica]PZR51642.1 hypothetical protein DNL40_15325 [Xylanimonas oleitrophica]
MSKSGRLQRGDVTAGAIAAAVVAVLIAAAGFLAVWTAGGQAGDVRGVGSVSVESTSSAAR